VLGGSAGRGRKTQTGVYLPICRPRIPFHRAALFTRGTSRQKGRSSVLGFGFILTTCLQRCFSQLPRLSTMDAQQKPRDGILSALNVAIEVMTLAKEVSSITPAKAVFGSVSVLLTMIRVCYPLFSDDRFPVHM